MEGQKPTQDLNAEDKILKIAMYAKSKNANFLVHGQASIPNQF